MNQPRWLTESEMRAWLGYRRMRLLMDAEIDRDLANEAGLSGQDYDVLSRLSVQDEHRMRFGALGEQLHWSRSRLSHHLSRMEKRDLVRRHNHPDDGRGAVVELTEKGWQAVRTAAPGHVESVRRHLIDRLTPEQVRVLGDIAETVLPEPPR